MLWKIVTISLLMVIRMAKTVPSIGCTCNQQTIDCSSRQLTGVPQDLPTQFLNGGSFGNPLLPEVTTTIFTSLNLANNQLEELPTTLLSEKLPHLQSLDLSNNKILEITRIQSVVLSKQLLYFKLSSNPIRSLGLSTDTVLYSQSISHLDISDCAISSITNPVTFMYTMNLTHLDLSGNPLIVVDHLVSSTLIRLDLSRCLLGLNDKGLREETFTDLPNLRSLNLSMNAHLTRFPPSKQLSYSLLYLDASYCALEKMDLRSFPNLQQATLKGNVIKILHDNMLSDNVFLQSLDISENSIHHVEQYAFVGGNSLGKLDLSLNLLSNLNWNTFLHTPRLNVLNISRNLFTYLDEISAPSLIVLDASKCQIVKLNARFLEKTHAIQYLNLSYNSIEILPRRLSNTRLLNLDLSFCRISDIQDETFQGLPSLVSLNLMGNRLTSPMKESAFDQLINMRELNLLNNPWHCDCNDSDFHKLWKYLSSYPTKTKYLKTLSCHSPKEQSGISWERSCFVSSTSGEHTGSKNAAWLSVLVPFLTLCCLLAIMIVIRQAYASHALEIERELHQRVNSNSERRGFTPRVAPHFFDEDLERGIQLSVNESMQRSPIQELSKLPSYEEALLLPKLLNREDLQNIIKQYEESDRFERSVLELEPDQSDSRHYNEDSISNPSTSRH